jgi:hypothetical protein
MAGNVTHCPISRCATQDGYCESVLSSGETTALLLLVATPLLIALLAPIFARSSRPCATDDDSPLSSTYIHSPSTRQRAAPIDPPMFLCGVGLMPLECGMSGLLTVITVMWFAFVVVFFALLNDERPCTTALGRCRTISCVCGNVIPEGYVFMFCMLCTTSVLLVQRFSRMVHHHRVQHRVLKPSLIAGSLLITLTGIFPERYDANNGTSGALGVFYALHLLGVFGSGLLLLWIPFLWFAEHWWTHRREVPLRSLLARSAYFLAVVAFGVAMLVAGSDTKCARPSQRPSQPATHLVWPLGRRRLTCCAHSSHRSVVDQVHSYCSRLHTPSECRSWPQLTPADCAAAHTCVDHPDAAGCDGFMQPNFMCDWLPSNLGNWTKRLAPAAYVETALCVRSHCPLGEYAMGVALEFAVLFLTVSYVSTFGLHDVRRLLDRPPPPVRTGAQGADPGPLLSMPPRTELPTPLNAVDGGAP